jgi:hypothetical protein
MRLRSRLIALATFGVAIVALASVIVANAGGPSRLPKRSFVPYVSSDAETPTAVPTLVPPPPGPNYCVPSALQIPSPPNRIAGLFAIAGQPAPAGTLVTLTFDGARGPSMYTTDAGGYRVDYAAGGQGHDPPCTNVVGAEMGLLVNGVLVDTGARVGDLQTYLFFLFDLNIP